MTPVQILGLAVVAICVLFLAAYWLTERSLTKHFRQAAASMRSAALAFDAHWDDVAALSSGDELSRRRDGHR